MKRLAISVVVIALAAAACTRFVNLAPPPDAVRGDAFVPDGDEFVPDASSNDGGIGPQPDASPFDASLVD